MIYDYVDMHVPVLERMYHKRLNGYAQIGYKTLAGQNQPDKINLIYDTTNFVPIVKNDFVDAKKEILIVSPFLRKKRIDTVLEWLEKSLFSDVSVTVITRSIESYKDQEQIKRCIDYLQTFATVIQKNNLHQKFVSIDNRLAWYGNIDLLGYGNSDESIMRLESKELVEELKAIVDTLK
jgi:hypothetical protein